MIFGNGREGRNGFFEFLKFKIYSIRRGKMGCPFWCGYYCREVPQTIRGGSDSSSSPSRRSVLGFAVTLAMITYVDRVCISQAAPFIQHEPEAHGGADGFGVLGF